MKNLVIVLIAFSLSFLGLKANAQVAVDYTTFVTGGVAIDFKSVGISQEFNIVKLKESTSTRKRIPGLRFKIGFAKYRNNWRKGDENDISYIKSKSILSGDLVVLTSQRKSAFEACIGFNYDFENRGKIVYPFSLDIFAFNPPVQYSNTSIRVSAGYRYTGERFVLRAGISNPELCYVSIGTRF